MPESMSRRRALAAAAGTPAVMFVEISGCSGGDPNQFVSGTMVKPLESVERADETAAKKLEADLKLKKTRRGSR